MSLTEADDHVGRGTNETGIASALNPRLATLSKMISVLRGYASMRYCNAVVHEKEAADALVFRVRKAVSTSSPDV